MRLMKALEPKRGDVISLVGAGGKTTAMFRLAEELSSSGWRVITTTTTMIWSEERCEPTILEHDVARMLTRAREALAQQERITVASGFHEVQGKLIGIDPSVVDALVALPEVDAVIVEADGAKGRSLKAPAEYEPVIPSTTSLLIPVAAADAIGQPLSKRVVHRPEIVSRLAGVELGQIITGALMSTILTHPQAGLKNAPERARIVPLVNKVNDAYVELAREVARSLLKSPRVERVLLGAVAEEEPILEVWGRVAAIVLAAGGSRRFGSPKQLLRWKGKTLLEHTVDTVVDSSVQHVFVVLGHQADSLRLLLRDRPIQVVVNEEWVEGQSSSLQAGLRAVPSTCHAALFVLADQPNLTPQLIDDLLTTYRRTLAPIVAPVHRGQRRNPVLFDRALFGELQQLRGDQGGRSIVERHQAQAELLEVEDESIFLDIDRVSDYEGAK